ncbi:MAG: hypothetical protein ABMA64_26540, partial [Myxococcota bacterium]
MIPWLVTASAAPVRLDRVDLLSETPGTWLATELPRAAAAPGTVAARWVAQVSPVVTWGRCELSASLAAQSLGVSLPLDPVRPVSFDAAAVALGQDWRAIEAGAAGYLTKQQPLPELLAGIRAVWRGQAT